MLSLPLLPPRTGSISEALTHCSFAGDPKFENPFSGYNNTSKDVRFLQLPPLSPHPATLHYHHTPVAMSLTQVAVDVAQLVLNQWATAPPHKAPQECRFK